MPTHRAIATTAKGVLEEIQSTSEEPGHDDVVVENYYPALIAPDAYQLDIGMFISAYPQILGFSAGGKVEKVGASVADLKPGDRVAAYTFHANKIKSLQDYSVVPRDMVAKVPDSLSLKDAASIPDNLVCAYFTIFSVLGLHAPSSFPASSAPPDAEAPILVYGASSSAGQYMVQLLALTGYKRILVTASTRNHALLTSLGASHAFDYRSPSVVEDILSATGGEKIKVVIDPIAARPGLELIVQVVGQGTKLAVLLPIKDGESVTNDAASEMHLGVPQWASDLLSGVDIRVVATFTYRQDEELKGHLMIKTIPQLLESGALKPNKIRLLNQGTFKERSEEGLELLRTNKVSGEKVIVEIKPE